MSVSNLWRVILIASFSFFISACKPIPSFSVSPDPVIAGQVALFDASATIITDEEAEDEFEDKKDKKIKEEKHKEKHKDKNKPKKTVTYNWTFGDGSTAASGITVTHVFATPGDYSVTLTVKDRDGEVAKLGKVVLVKPATGALARASVQVQGADGVLLKGAQVTVNGTSATTNDKGIATLSSTAGTKTIVVTNAGYITQAVSTALADNKTSNVQLIMLPVKEVQTIGNIQAAHLINASTLNASVRLPAGALVNPDGSTATGTVTLQLTPWDITNTNMYAMLGDGKAKAANGSIISLISAGMITIDFFNAANQHLQLGVGKKADIQMDLPYDSINGQALAEGSTIPLWTFNETQALWIQEGTGTVIVSYTSPVGLAVKATVGHFSTWNWDFAVTNPTGGATNNITVFCIDSTNQAIPCAVTADVTLPDGSKFYEHGQTSNTSSADAQGLTILSVPINASILWTGTTQDGNIGTAFGSSGTINILMGTPTTSNFVQCAKPDLTATACNVELSITKTDGTLSTRSYSIPTQGGRINTLAVTTTSLAWVGSTRIIQEGSEFVHYEGASASSGSSGTVSLVMTSRVIELSKTLLIKCDPVAIAYTYLYDNVTGIVTTNTTTVALDSCNINVQAYGSESYFFNSITVPAGTLVSVSIPPNAADDVYINANGSSGALNYFYGSAFFTSSQLTNNQTITLRLNNDENCDGPCTPT